MSRTLCITINSPFFANNPDEMLFIFKGGVCGDGAAYDFEDTGTVNLKALGLYISPDTLTSRMVTVVKDYLLANHSLATDSYSKTYVIGGPSGLIT